MALGPVWGKLTGGRTVASRAFIEEKNDNFAASTAATIVVAAAGSTCLLGNCSCVSVNPCLLLFSVGGGVKDGGVNEGAVKECG